MPSKGNHEVIEVYSTDSEGESYTEGQQTTTSSVKRKREDSEDQSGSEEEDDSGEAESSDSPERKRMKQEAKRTRWPWISQCMGWLKIQFEDGELHVYDEGGKIFRTCGETMEDMLDELEVYLDECDGDPSTRSDYGDCD